MNHKDILIFLQACAESLKFIKGFGYGAQFEQNDLQRDYPLLFAETDMQFIWDKSNARSQFLEKARFSFVIVDRVSESVTTSNVPMPAVKIQITNAVATCQQAARNIVDMLGIYLEKWNGKVLAANVVTLPDINGQYADVTYGVRVEIEILSLVKTDDCTLPADITPDLIACDNVGV